MSLAVAVMASDFQLFQPKNFIDATNSGHHAYRHQEKGILKMYRQSFFTTWYITQSSSQRFIENRAPIVEKHHFTKNKNCYAMA